MANNEKRSSLRGLESAIFDLLHTGEDAEQWAEWLKVPLQHAAAMGDSHLVLTLQKAGANGNPLHAAVAAEQAVLVRDLVKRGAFVTEPDENGDSPLHIAAARGDEATVSVLLENGAPTNAQNNVDRTPLHVAAENGRLAAVNVILAHGADIITRRSYDDRWKGNSSALGLAAAKGHVEIVSAFIRSGANVNAADFITGSTALHKAARNNEVGVIDVLVEAGADVDARENTSGGVPLHYACKFSCFGAILALLKYGARLDEKEAIYHRAPIHLMAEKGHLPATRALLDADATVNAVDAAGGTALQIAAAGGHQEMSRVIVQAGADVNLARSNGITALHHFASRHDSAGTVRVLVEAGATVDARDVNGKTPLYRVLCGGYRVSCESLSVLLEYGADPNEKHPGGYFPLHLAVGLSTRTAAVIAVDLLLRSGADETAVDNNGLTPLETAKEMYCVVPALRRLLTQAPVDRNWRRQGWLLLYHAYPRRLRPILGTGAARGDRAKKRHAGSLSTEEETTSDASNSVVREGAARGVARAHGGAPCDWSGDVGGGVGVRRRFPQCCGVSVTKAACSATGRVSPAT